MTYRWEPTTPLDRILATGFKRIDEAVEGVIERLAPTLNAEYLNIPHDEAERIYNYSASNMIQKMAVRQAEGLQNAFQNQNQLLNRMGQNTQGGLFGPATQSPYCDLFNQLTGL